MVNSSDEIKASYEEELETFRRAGFTLESSNPLSFTFEEQNECGAAHLSASRLLLLKLALVGGRKFGLPPWEVWLSLRNRVKEKKAEQIIQDLTRGRETIAIGLVESHCARLKRPTFESFLDIRRRFDNDPKYTDEHFIMGPEAEMRFCPPSDVSIHEWILYYMTRLVLKDPELTKHYKGDSPIDTILWHGLASRDLDELESAILSPQYDAITGCIGSIFGKGPKALLDSGPYVDLMGIRGLFSQYIRSKCRQYQTLNLSPRPTASPGDDSSLPSSPSEGESDNNGVQLEASAFTVPVENDGKSYYAPYVAVIQSSGYGKTRLALETYRSFFTIYMCLRPAGSSGVPPRSPIADRFLGLNVEIEFLRFYLALFTVYQEFLNGVLKHPLVSEEELYRIVSEGFYGEEQFWESVENRFEEEVFWLLTDMCR